MIRLVPIEKAKEMLYRFGRCCTGTSLRDFLRVADVASIPEDVVAEYDDGMPPGGVTVYKPELTNAPAT
jgi:hypothetical protein